LAHPYEYEFNGPTADGKGWMCGGGGGIKQVWALCSHATTPGIKMVDGGNGYTAVSCNSGEFLLGGGCTSNPTGYMLQKNLVRKPPFYVINGPNNSTSWMCGGNKASNRVWSVCATTATPVLLEVRDPTTIAWANTQCHHGQKVLCGGCAGAGFQQITAGDTVYLKAAQTAKHIDIEGISVAARWNSHGTWQKIAFETSEAGVLSNGDTVFVKALTTVLYLNVNGTAIYANSTSLGNWTNFTIEKEGGGVILAEDTIYLKAPNGNYIDIQDTAVQARYALRNASSQTQIIVQKSVIGTAVDVGGLCCFCSS